MRTASGLARLLRLCRKEPRLAWLLLDNLITTFGASFTMIALPFLVMRLTGRALDLGITGAIEALPSIVFLFFFSGFLDKANPIRVLWICRALFVLINLGIGVLTWLDRMSIQIVYTLALIGGIVWAIAYPAGRAVFALYIRKRLVPTGNAVFSVASSLATMMLPLLAGTLILSSTGKNGLAIAFWIDAASVTVSLLLVAAVWRRGPVRGRTQDAATHAPSAGAKPAIAATPAGTIPRSYYAYLLLSSILVFGPVQILLPVLLIEHQDSRYFLVYIAQFAGIMAAATLASGANPTLPAVIRRILACWGLAILAYLLLARTTQLPWMLAAFALLAGASNFYGIHSLSWLQKTAPTDAIGREMTWFSAVTLGATPITALLTGYLVDAFRFTFAVQTLALSIGLATAIGALYLRMSGWTQNEFAKAAHRR